jgi:hypothetical protein
MKRVAFLFVFAFSVAAGLQAQANWSFKGTVTKMQMGECVAQRGFKANMSGGAAPAGSTCPEYTVMSDKVVYVIVGRHSDEFIPLAENIDFVIHKNELVILPDNDKSKPRFAIQRMMLRADWDREEARKELATRIAERSASYESRNPPQTSAEAREVTSLQQ